MWFLLQKLVAKCSRKQAQIQSIQSEFEVAGAFDAFTSLEEVSPNSEWVDILAASWGIPCPEAEPTQMESSLKSLFRLRDWLRQAPKDCKQA